MNIELEIQNDKVKYGNIYSNIMFTLNEIEDFYEDTTIKERFYYRASSLLKIYLDMIDDITFEMNKKVGFFEKLKQKRIIEDKYNELLKFKSKNIRDFNKLSNCVNCSCLKCISRCKFNPCSRCKEEGYVKYCDKEHENLIKFDNLVEQQYNYETSQQESIDILSEIMIDENRYRMIYDRGEQNNLILTFDYSLKDGNIYGAVSDDDINVDKVIELFESNKS